MKNSTKNNFFQEIFVSAILIILLILFLNPFNFWMPTQFLTMIVLSFIVVFILFTSFVWRENSKDERESFHKIMAGRIAYLVGTVSLSLGIIVQSFQHKLDFWLPVTLSLMILAKIIGLIYSRIKY